MLGDFLSLEEEFAGAVNRGGVKGLMLNFFSGVSMKSSVSSATDLNVREFIRFLDLIVTRSRIIM